MLSVADTYTVSECLETITTVMEDFLWVSQIDQFSFHYLIRLCIDAASWRAGHAHDELYPAVAEIIKSSAGRIDRSAP